MRALWHFNLLVTIPLLPGWVVVLKMAAHILRAGRWYQRKWYIPYSQKIMNVCFDMSNGSLKDQLKGLPLFHLPWSFLMAEVASWVIFVKSI